MRWTMPRLFVALFAAPLMLASSTALAAGPADCLLATAKSCQYVVSSGGCEAQCTPGSFVAECDAQCTGSVQASCTGTCSADCSAMCTANPGSFSCSGYCDQSCQGSCSAQCTDSACSADCMADCSNRCEVSCSAQPPTATCDVQCQASCNGKCEVDVNIMCHANCTANLVLPTCQADCKLPQGALFCDGQYVDVAKAAQACIDYLKSQGVSFSESCSGGTNGGTTCSATVGCSAAPSLGAADRWGVLGISGVVMGLGLVVARRRRR
jgi:hypothetical protein